MMASSSLPNLGRRMPAAQTRLATPAAQARCTTSQSSHRPPPRATDKLPPLRTPIARAPTAAEARELQDWVHRSGIQPIFAELMEALLASRPQEPIDFIHAHVSNICGRPRPARRTDESSAKLMAVSARPSSRSVDAVLGDAPNPLVDDRAAEREQALLAKLSSGHMLSDVEVQQMKRLALEAKVTEGHLLSEEEGAQLRLWAVEAKLADGHLLSREEATLLKQQAVQAKIGEGKMLSEAELRFVKQLAVQEKVARGHMIDGEELRLLYAMEPREAQLQRKVAAGHALSVSELDEFRGAGKRQHGSGSSGEALQPASEAEAAESAAAREKAREKAAREKARQAEEEAAEAAADVLRQIMNIHGLTAAQLQRGLHLVNTAGGMNTAVRVATRALHG